MLQSPDRWLFVAQVGALPVGSIRFDRIDSQRLEVSLYLDPELLGLGLGPRLLLAGEQQMQGTIADASFEVDAIVVAGNAASQRLFEGMRLPWRAIALQKTACPLSGLPDDEPTATP